MTEQDKVTVDDIIGIVKTEEQTDSVEEVRKLRGRENKTAKRLFGVVKGHREHIADHTGRLYSDSEVADLLNTVYEENEQLKHQIETYKTGNALLKKTLDKEWK